MGGLELAGSTEKLTAGLKLSDNHRLEDIKGKADQKDLRFRKNLESSHHIKIIIFVLVSETTKNPYPCYGLNGFLMASRHGSNGRMIDVLHCGFSSNGRGRELMETSSRAVILVSR
ncbi:hypothetical protein TNCT_302931 [Trichonephila clavata]|uniref:Uncharacterized protein n=1 Tax=Trichonephila clavata TaxID=2740835 RepID=A0A8X6IH01_TRICU|nr:hypothetical protein TNCT_302931 [Trichonephila clavata]